MKQMKYQGKGTAPSFTMILIFYISIAVAIIVILILSINYNPPTNPRAYEQQFTPIIKHGSSIGLLDKTIQKTNRIKSVTRSVLKFIIMVIAVISATIFIMRFFEWISNELKVRINLFRIFGAFRSSSLANLNL